MSVGTALKSLAIPESHRDLVEGKGVVALSTVGPDGRPQTTAVWFLLDDDGLIRTSVETGRQKYQNLVREPKGTLFFLDPANPYRTLEVRADVEIERDDDFSFFDRVLAHYESDPAAVERGTRAIVTFVPRHVVSFG